MPACKPILYNFSGFGLCVKCSKYQQLKLAKYCEDMLDEYLLRRPLDNISVTSANSCNFNVFLWFCLLCHICWLLSGLPLSYSFIDILSCLSSLPFTTLLPSFTAEHSYFIHLLMYCLASMLCSNSLAYLFTCQLLSIAKLLFCNRLYFVKTRIRGNKWQTDVYVIKVRCEKAVSWCRI